MGGGNNVIIRVPSKNEHGTVLLNSDLNGTIDITISKQKVWNFNKYKTIFADFSILQNNSKHIFIIPYANYSKGSGYYLSYATIDKSNTTGNHEGDFYTLPCFRPIFEFKQ